MTVSRIPGPSLADLDRRRDAFATRVVREVRAVLRDAAGQLDAHVTLDDVTIVRTLWAERVPKLIDGVEESYRHGLGVIARGADSAVRAVTAAGDEVVPRVRNAQVEAYLAKASNRLVNLGDDVWGHARGELLTGMQAGESIFQLRDRVVSAVNLAAPRAEVIARTEVNAAANAGSVDEMRALGVNATKEWISTIDDRSRPSHVDADGQRVSLDEPFMIGGFPLDAPSDPDGDPGETINCRCTMAFDIAEDVVADTELAASAVIVAAEGEHSTGAMIALIPNDPDLDRLALAGGEPRDELHLTLWYLGDAVDWDPAQRAALVDGVTHAAGSLTPIAGNAFGANLWNPSSDSPAWVLAVGDEPSDGTDTLDVAHDATSPHRVSDPSAASGALAVPAQHTPWVPHICLAYSSDPEFLAALTWRLGPVTFDRVRVAFGGEIVDVPLGGGDVTLPASRRMVEATVPWHKVQNHANCPDGKPWAVVKDDDGSVAGCHATEGDADDQLAALYAGEADAEGDVTESQSDGVVRTATLGGKPSEGTQKDKRLKENQAVADVATLAEGDCPPGMEHHPDTGECVPADEMPPQMTTAPWTGVLCVEEVSTGDGREFKLNSLTWADPPLSLRWNKEDSHGGVPQTIAVNVGRIDRVWRDEHTIMGSGVFNLQEEDGRRAYQLVKDGFLRGVSIDADDIGEADIEYVWPEADGDEADEDGDIISILFGEPEKTIFHAGRIRAATLCDIPAFVEAYIAVDDAAAEAVAASATSRGVRPSEGQWNHTLHERRLTHVASADRAHAYAASLAIESGPAQHVLLHHEIGEDGSIGPANVAACASALGLLAGARGGLDLAPVDRRAAYTHLAEHMRDAGREPPPLLDALVAHAALDGEWRPDPSWFTDPKLPVLVPITITDQGRVYGHAAQWGQCHLGFTGECVTPPREDYHPYFMTGEVVCADGSRAAVGQITVGTGHAPLHYGASSAASHYDDTGAAVADVSVGNDRHGIWIAGALRPSADVAQVQALRAAGQLSGDWRRIGGKLRLVGLLAVNVPGYPVPRLRARVAAGAPQAMVAAGQTSVSHGLDQTDLERQALLALKASIARRVTQPVT